MSEDAMNMKGGYFMDESTDTTLNLIPAGIHENVTLENIAFEPAKSDGTGSMVLRFYFKDSAGNTFNHAEFPIDPEQVKKNAANWNADPAELLNKSFRTLGGKVRHILSAFVPKDKLKINGATWDAFCKQAIETAGDLYKGELFRVKIVLNSKDYTSFPRTANAPFIQNMKQPNTLKINPKYDRIEPQSPDKSEDASAADAFGDAPSSDGQDFAAF